MGPRQRAALFLQRQQLPTGRDVSDASEGLSLEQARSPQEEHKRLVVSASVRRCARAPFFWDYLLLSGKAAGLSVDLRQLFVEPHKRAFPVGPVGMAFD
jgi:hypothetical protein